MGGGCAEPPESSTSGGLEMISGGGVEELHHVACGILVPQPGIVNPYCLHWEHGVLTTGLLGKSLELTVALDLKDDIFSGKEARQALQTKGQV